MSYTIVGVIGHIDHGKTSLVAALTGVDTDTHPEEKKRGITIDLGFAAFTHQGHTFAMVDAPGHQKYIGNLLAGVSGVDLGLLVVAGDQGIQAQTLEHAAILRSLGVKKLVAVISRVDLTTADSYDSLKEELCLFLGDYGYFDIPCVAVSTLTRQGMDELKGLLVQHARTEPRTGYRYFRMPVDRSFTIEGRGTVVAGTPWSGTVEIGSHLAVVRTGDRVRVRELEVHGRSVDQSRLGMRTAMNIVGAGTEIVRGDELVDIGTHPPVRRLIVQLRMFPDAKPIRCPATVHLHTATCMKSARIFGAKRLSGGESTAVVIETETPVVATFGQQILLRRPYPVGSFAGATVLGTISMTDRHTARHCQLGRSLVDSTPEDRIVAWVELLGQWTVDPLEMELGMGIPAQFQREAVRLALDRERIEMPIADLLVARERIETITQYLEKVMLHQAEATEEPWLDSAALVARAQAAGSPELVSCLIERMVAQKRLVKVNHLVAISSEDTALSKKQRARMDQILQLFAGSRTPPTIKEIATQLQTTMDAVTSLVRFATQQRILVDMGNGFLIDRAAFGAICQDLQSLFETKSEQTVAEIRDHLDITRKHAIPLLEYCDAHSITVRQGDTRRAGPELAVILAELADDHD